MTRGEGPDTSDLLTATLSSKRERLLTQVQRPDTIKLPDIDIYAVYEDLNDQATALCIALPWREAADTKGPRRCCKTLHCHCMTCTCKAAPSPIFRHSQGAPMAGSAAAPAAAADGASAASAIGPGAGANAAREPTTGCRRAAASARPLLLVMVPPEFMLLLVVVPPPPALLLLFVVVMALDSVLALPPLQLLLLLREMPGPLAGMYS